MERETFRTGQIITYHPNSKIKNQADSLGVCLILFVLVFVVELLLAASCVTVHETIHASCGIDQL